MSYNTDKASRRLASLAMILLCSTAMVPAFAADPPAAAPSTNPTINLVNMLVKRGVLTRAEADVLIRQAMEQAVAARQAPPTRTATHQGSGHAAATVSGATTAATAAAGRTVVQMAPPATDDTMHITYVPQVVQDQITQQVQQKVLAQAKAENWASPYALPDWVKNLHFYGDIRARYEGNFYPRGNDTTGEFPNFNAINTGSPYDTASGLFPPQLNVDQDRNYFALRARFGVEANLGDGFSTNFRLASGQSDSPVSENQILGYANNAQGGQFSKYSVWIDRAEIRYATAIVPDSEIDVHVGRFDNPFFHTSMIWADDLGFDGLAVTGNYAMGHGLKPFLVLGAFPVFNTDLNFGSTQPAKYGSDDKYLFAVQGGTDIKFNDDYDAKVGVAYYYFNNMAGQLSAPCTIISASDSCNTDDLRPSFAQNGNTYMALRNILPTAANNFGTIDQFQYYGLASQFHELALTGEFDINNFNPTHIWAAGEFVDNLAFNKGAIGAVAVNNRGPNSLSNTIGNYVGGNMGYLVNLSIGQKALTHRWDWNASIGYRYVESDAEVDAFDDSDFGLGGTNLKGYTLQANLGLSTNVWADARWMSADSIVGPQYSVDVLIIDLNARF